MKNPKKSLEEVFANLGFAKRYNKKRSPMEKGVLGVQMEEGVEVPGAKVRGVTVKPVRRKKP